MTEAAPKTITTIERTRCALTAGLLKYLTENPDQAALVGPYSHAKTISGISANFYTHRQNRGYKGKAEQHTVIGLDPVTGTSDIFWEVRIIGAESAPPEPRAKWGLKTGRTIANTPEKEEADHESDPSGV